jgi:hypothetical protein
MKRVEFRLFLLFFCCAGTLLILQNAFDSSDHRKAERAVREYRVNGSGPFGAFVEARAPGGAWATEITHGCRGVVRTTYDAPGARYEFDYDVPAHGIHPANELARGALEAFVAATANAGRVDGGAPHD